MILNAKQLYVADKNDVDTLEQLDKENKVTLHLEEKYCNDFLIDPYTKAITPKVLSICINGTQWNLTPGENIVPESVYDMFQRSVESAKISKRKASPLCIGTL
jgi:hypothetical protein